MNGRIWTAARIGLFASSAVLWLWFQWWPGLATAAPFWSAVLVWDVDWLHRATTRAQRAGRSLTLLGALSNALVTLTNDGRMPVVGVLCTSGGPWVPASSAHHFLALADRYLGFSVGDFLLITGFLVPLLAAASAVVRECWQDYAPSATALARRVRA